MKRFIDIVVSLFGLIVLGPILLIFMFLVWLQDRHSPFYLGVRVAKGGGEFKMVKLRSMIVNADKTGVASTSADDRRVTKVGMLIRKYKLDEFTQLWNVLKGDMSLVGPRPQVRQDVNLYTTEEMRMLTVRPGITDLASIVFSDEGDILKGKPDPDLAYNQLIRPWKSRLALFYIDHSSVGLDAKLVLTTVKAILSKPKALASVVKILEDLGAEKQLIEVASRKNPLVPHAPPGTDQIVESVR